MVTNYQRGRAFEYRVKKFFENQGYFMNRSAGSKFPDLFGFNGKNEVVVIECKSNGYLSRDEKIAFMDLKLRFPLASFKVAFKKGKKMMLRDV